MILRVFQYRYPSEKNNTKHIKRFFRCNFAQNTKWSMKKIVRYMIIIILSLLLPACPKFEVLPEIPEVEFQSFILSIQTNDLGNELLLGELVFTFRDGDGDIGLPEPDTIAPGDTTNFNLFLTLNEKVNGNFRKIENSDLPSPLYYRIPYMNPEGQNKTLQGEIKVELEYFTIEYDTIKYDFYIKDRAGHKSNVESTSEISFTEWKDVI